MVVAVAAMGREWMDADEGEGEGRIKKKKADGHHSGTVQGSAVTAVMDSSSTGSTMHTLVGHTGRIARSALTLRPLRCTALHIALRISTRIAALTVRPWARAAAVPFIPSTTAGSDNALQCGLTSMSAISVCACRVMAMHGLGGQRDQRTTVNCQRLAVAERQPAHRSTAGHSLLDCPFPVI